MNQNKALDAVNYLLEYLDEETKFNTPYSETVWIVHADIADLFDGLKNLKKRLEREISNDSCGTWIDDMGNGGNKMLTDIDFMNVSNAYSEGLTDAWDCVKRILRLDWDERYAALKYDSPMSLLDMIENTTPADAMVLLDEYEKEKKKRIAREKLVDEKLNEMMCKSWADPITEEEIYDALARRSKKKKC